MLAGTCSCCSALLVLLKVTMADASDGSLSGDEDIEIYTPDEMLYMGLKLLKWEDHQLARVCRETRVTRYRGHFGANPHIYAQMWEDLQTTTLEAARIDPSRRCIKIFHATLHFLYRYPKEIERETTWNNVCHMDKLRTEGWYYIDKIRALLALKAGWPADNFGDDTWVMSVDGVHFVTYEPNHDQFPKDSSYFSYKHHAAGFNYEIGISLYESKLVWFNGPFKAGDFNDIKMFTDGGLKDKLQSLKKMVIADHGYSGYPTLVSTSNSQDSKEVSKFKVRARQRHEKYNGKLKEFECLDSRFRHTGKLQACFEAVNVIVAYKMEMGEPLFDI